MAQPRVLGRLLEFDAKADNIATYLERVELYFTANAVNQDRQVAVLLTAIGAQTYDVLRSLLAPTLPKDKSFEELREILQNHFDPKPLVIGERFYFYKRCQQANESIADFIAALRQLSIRCEFGTFLDQALRDRFVCGVSSEAIQKRLLAKDGLTLAKAQEIAQGMEAAEKNSKDLKKGGEEPTTSGVNYAGESSLHKKKACYRCGRRHDPGTCKFKGAVCHKCGKAGHIAPACRSGLRHPRNHPGTTGPPPSQVTQGNSTVKGHKWVGPAEHDGDESPERGERLAMCAIKGSDPQPPITTFVEVNDKAVEFELDTGATVTVMSEKMFFSLFPNSPLQKSTVARQTYTGESLKILGEVTVTVTSKSQKPQKLPLVVVQGSGPPLLGGNWLQQLQLDWSSIKTLKSTHEQLQEILQRFDNLFTDELGTIVGAKARLSVLPDAKPKFCKPRSVPYALKDAVFEELDRMERSGVLTKVDHSEWATPIVVVPKQDKRVRICGDYKVTVNPVLAGDQYPLPRPDDLFATLAGGKHFTTLDLSHAYNQIVLDDESCDLLTINTPRGLYRQNRLPFGISSAPSMFQRKMDTILQGIDGVICYIDDILITGKTEEEHLATVKVVLQRLSEHGIRLKKSKCSFLKPCVQYLGHRIDADGIHATDSKVKAIVEAPAPRNLQELRSFLGLLNYYGRFIPNLSSLIHPLNALLRQDAKWNWTKACQDAFEAAKSKVVAPNVLVHYDPTLPIRMAGDASAYGVGAVISHVMPDGSERPIAFASRTLLSSEQNYSQVEKEALSLIFGVSKFHTYLYGRKFVLVTDHKPLTTILGHKKGIPPMAAARLQRWAVRLSAYDYEIEFRRTNEHSNADGLSRLLLHQFSEIGYTPEPAIFNIQQIESLPLTAKQIATATRTDSVLSKVYHYITKGWPCRLDEQFASFSSKKDQMTVEGGCVLWGTRVVIPEKWRETLLTELHRDHPGICKMKGIARSHFWWPGLDQGIENLAKSCLECQAVKNTPAASPLLPWAWPTKPLQRVHIDFAGPFQGAMFLVAIDAYSKWPEVFIMQTTTVAKTIDALRQMFAAYGLPEQVVSDNGPQFTSEEFAVFLKKNGVKHTRSAPYHPATNGLAECFVQSMKQALKSTLSSGRSLPQRLYNFLLTYRSSAHSTTGVTPSSLFLKREVRTRFDLLLPDKEANVMEKQSQQKRDHDKHARARQFSVGDLVMARNLRPGPEWIPAVVVARLGPLSYLVETEDKQTWRRHVDHIKERVLRQTPSSSQPCTSEPSLGFGVDADPEPPEVEQERPPPPRPDPPLDANQQPHDDPEDEVLRYPQREHRTPNWYRPTF